MERELNKLFNDTNYNKENVIIREIWSIKLELQNFFEEFICATNNPNYWRHHAAMLGVQAIALYALVIYDWRISNNCVYALFYRPPREGAMKLWRHMHKVCCMEDIPLNVSPVKWCFRYYM